MVSRQSQTWHFIHVTPSLIYFLVLTAWPPNAFGSKDSYYVLCSDESKNYKTNCEDKFLLKDYTTIFPPKLSIYGMVPQA